MSETREAIERYVTDNPGVHFNHVVRALDVASGQVQYHVRRLVGRGDLVSEERYGRTHYFPPAFDEWERGALALLRRETARGILIELLSGDATRPGEVADRLGVARSTLEWHLDHLVECGVVRKSRDSSGRVTLECTRPEATAGLLAAITPAHSDRFVDRFARLVDLLLEGE